MFSFKNHYYSIVFSFCALLVLAWILYSSVGRLNAINIPVESKLVNDADKSKRRVDLLEYNAKKISNSRFFNVAVQPKKREVVAKKTSLKLKLEGIIAAENDRLSRAVIRSSSKRAVTYKLGDNIQGTNAELSSVEGLRVLIDRAGVLESLELEREKIKLQDEK